MYIERLWGDLWVVQRSDNVWIDLLVKLILSIILAVFTAVVLLTIVGAFYLFKSHKQGSVQTETAASLPTVEDRLTLTNQALACPHCGNTRSIDVRPCIRCGRSF